MEENTGNIIYNLKKFMKPSISKVLLFLILAFLLIFLPLYPVHMDRYTGPEEFETNQLEESGTKLKSIYLVLEGDYNWTEMDYSFRQDSLFYTFTIYHLSYYDANPAYLAVYSIFFFGAYYASCFYVESSKSS